MNRQTLILLGELVAIAVLGFGIQLIVASFSTVRAGVGAFCVTVAIGWLVLLLAAQLPSSDAGGG